MQCTHLHRAIYRVLVPFASRLSGNPKGLTQLQRMGIGLIIAMLSVIETGVTEIVRLKHVILGEQAKLIEHILASPAICACWCL